MCSLPSDWWLTLLSTVNYSSISNATLMNIHEHNVGWDHLVWQRLAGVFWLANSRCTQTYTCETHGNKAKTLKGYLAVFFFSGGGVCVVLSMQWDNVYLWRKGKLAIMAPGNKLAEVVMPHIMVLHVISWIFSVTEKIITFCYGKNIKNTNMLVGNLLRDP